MAVGLDELLASAVDWHADPGRPFHFAAAVAGTACQLRLNDFPDENIATVWVGGLQHELNEFPKAWRLPRHRGE
jgi:hypothetical protein